MQRRLLSRGGRGEKLRCLQGDVKLPTASSCCSFAGLCPPVLCCGSARWDQVGRGGQAGPCSPLPGHKWAKEGVRSYLKYRDPSSRHDYSSAHQGRAHILPTPRVASGDILVLCACLDTLVPSLAGLGRSQGHGHLLQKLLWTNLFATTVLCLS